MKTAGFEPLGAKFSTPSPHQPLSNIILYNCNKVLIPVVDQGEPILPLRVQLSMPGSRGKIQEAKNPGAEIEGKIEYSRARIFLCSLTGGWSTRSSYYMLILLSSRGWKLVLDINEQDQLVSVMLIPTRVRHKG